MDTSDCAAAIEPGFFHGEGAEERDRFLTAARRRGELALVLASIGDIDDDRPRSVLSPFDSSVHLGKTFTSVSGRRLPAHARLETAAGLSRADHDLALRLLARGVDRPWWSLNLSGAELHRGDGWGSTYHEAEGQLHPLLVDPLGEPVVAAWTSPEEDQRWYIIPDATDWNTILDWLIHHALPEYVPTALRRARSPHFADPELQAADESAARQALAELDAHYAEERLRIVHDLSQAQALAEPVRYGLLYGTGADLVDAVAAALNAAGVHTVDLDMELGGTRSADLLASADGPPHRLVEIKAASGAASERLVRDLQRHLDTWPELRPDIPVTGGVLVVNHQHRSHPIERTPHVYARPEFVATLPVTVLSTTQLFQWWRTRDWLSIRTAALGDDRSPPPATAAYPQADPSTTPKPARWRRLSKRPTR